MQSDLPQYTLCSVRVHLNLLQENLGFQIFSDAELLPVKLISIAIISNTRD